MDLQLKNQPPSSSAPPAASATPSPVIRQRRRPVALSIANAPSKTPRRNWKPPTTCNRRRRRCHRLRGHAKVAGGCESIIVFAVRSAPASSATFWNLCPADWSQVMNINVQAPVNVMHAFAHFFETKAGSILIAPGAGQIGSKRSAV